MSFLEIQANSQLLVFINKVNKYAIIIPFVEDKNDSYHVGEVIETHISFDQAIIYRHLDAFQQI